MAHKPFTDRAGYIRHCWECKHAYEWDGGADAWCDARSEPDTEGEPLYVEMWDSPNNPCSVAGGCEHYEPR